MPQVPRLFIAAKALWIVLIRRPARWISAIAVAAGIVLLGIAARDEQPTDHHFTALASRSASTESAPSDPIPPPAFKRTAAQKAAIDQIVFIAERDGVCGSWRVYGGSIAEVEVGDAYPLLTYEQKKILAQAFAAHLKLPETCQVDFIDRYTHHKLAELNPWGFSVK